MRRTPETGFCNSDFLNGLDVAKAKERMAAWLEEHGRGEKSHNYKLRDWLFSRQRYWGEPFPVVHFEDGSYATVPVDQCRWNCLRWMNTSPPMMGGRLWLERAMSG